MYRSGKVSIGCASNTCCTGCAKPGLLRRIVSNGETGHGYSHFTLLLICPNVNMPQPLGRDSLFITYSKAADDESNILKQLKIAQKNSEFILSLTGDISAIESIISHHLLTSGESCIVSQPNQWIKGGFNVCIPAEVLNGAGGPSRKVLLRCPLPHSLAEYPGSISEKMRCEVATYVFMQRNCRDIQIPHLWGFRFPDSSAVCLSILSLLLDTELRSIHTYRISLLIRTHTGFSPDISFSSMLIAGRCCQTPSISIWEISNG